MAIRKSNNEEMVVSEHANNLWIEIVQEIYVMEPMTFYLRQHRKNWTLYLG